jgi:tetratricopeptide (TPR) repeat protein
VWHPFPSPDPDSWRKVDRSVAGFDRLLVERPSDPDVHNSIARWLYSRDEYHWALKNLLRALQLQPDHYGATCTLAWLRATCPDKTLRSGPEAVLLARRAYEQGLTRRANETEWMLRNHLVLLAAAHAEAGEWNQAVAHQRSAIRCTSTKSHLPKLHSDLESYLNAQAVKTISSAPWDSANDA